MTAPNEGSAYNLFDKETGEVVLRVVAATDENFVYLSNGVNQTDFKVHVKTNKTYQWKFGGWESTNYVKQEYDSSDLGDLMYFDGVVFDCLE